MGENASDLINYFMSIPVEFEEELAYIRHFDNLRVGYEGGIVWLKGFEEQQIRSLEVKLIMDKSLYYEKDNKLYLLDSILPECNIPSPMWSAIKRAIPIEKPKHNNNLFEVNGEIKIDLVEDTYLQDSEAMLTSLSDLSQYIDTASDIRLKPLHWVIINNYALIIGKPLLPLPGKTFWRSGSFYLPSGYNLNFPLLYKSINHKINPRNNIVLWDENGEYSIIRLEDLQTLSLSSVRKTLSINV